MKTESPRQIAYYILYQVENQGAYSDKLLASIHQRKDLTSRDCALVNQLVKGVLENRRRIDHILEPCLKRGFSSLPSKIQTILRLGVYQIIELRNVSVSRAVSECVELAKVNGHAGTAKLVNGVLRNILRNIEDEGKNATPSTDNSSDTDAIRKVPNWIKARLTDQYGEERCESILSVIDHPHRLSFRVNSQVADRESVQLLLRNEGWYTEPSKLSPESLVVTTRTHQKKLHELQAFLDGMIYVQDEASIVVAPILEPQPGELIVDLCSAPGGKATHLAQLSQDQAVIIAVDPSVGKLVSLAENCRRLKISSVTPVVCDGRYFGSDGFADKVLVDAPCSGFGALGKKKDIRWNRTEAQLEELVALQTALLNRAIDLVKLGGSIIYSTCSIDQAENEAVILKVLKSGRAKLSPIPPRFVVGEPVLDGAAFRLLPDKHKTTGAFVCVLTR